MQIKKLTCPTKQKLVYCSRLCMMFHATQQQRGRSLDSTTQEQNASLQHWDSRLCVSWQGQSAGPGATRDIAMGSCRESGWGCKRRQEDNVDSSLILPCKCVLKIDIHLHDGGAWRHMGAFGMHDRCRWMHVDACGCIWRPNLIHRPNPFCIKCILQRNVAPNTTHYSKSGETRWTRLF